MQATDNGPLAKAIEYLGAEALGADEPVVEVAPGYHAFKSENPDTLKPCWRVASAADMVKCGEYLPRREGDAPPEWVMDEAIMPEWWAPSQRETTRVVTDDGAVSYLDAEPWTTDLASLYRHATFTRIAADLTTGAEVPA